MFSDELLLDVRRILETEAHESASPLDDLSVNFNPASVLNDFFPDGAFSFSRSHFRTSKLTEKFRRNFPHTYQRRKCPAK